MAEETSPQQHVHTTALSEFVVYSLSERDRKVGPVPLATARGTDILLFQWYLEQIMLLRSM
jgi:hypothetical protein